MSQHNLQFYRKLNQRRESLHITWVELCSQAGVPRRTIYQLADGYDVRSSSLLMLNNWLVRNSVQTARIEIVSEHN